MEYRTLGRTGLRVSALGFGCGAIGGLMVRGEEAEQRRTFTRALEAGINYFDTAPSYGDGRSEETLGRILAELRPDVYVGTKVNLTPDEVTDAPQAIRRALEASLRRLGRDSVDLFQLHNRVGAAPAGQESRSVPVSAVLGPIAEGFAAVREAGLTRFIGLTGLGDASALHEVIAAGVYDTIQSYVNALNPSAGWSMSRPVEQDFGALIERAAAAGMGVIAIRVLAAGALAVAGERHPNAGDPGTPLVAGGEYDADLERARALGALATELGLESPAELSFRLVLSQPGVSTALVGYSEYSHLEAALRWTERGPLDAATVQRVVQLAEA